MEGIIFPKPVTREPEKKVFLPSPQPKVHLCLQDLLLCWGKFFWVSSLNSCSYNLNSYPLLLYSEGLG